MQLKEYKKEAYELSGIASNLIRQFAFAAIAIIWIFKFDKPEQNLLPPELIRPLIFIVVTLVLDLLQYLIPAIIYTIFFLYHERKNKGKTDVEIKASFYYTIPNIVCFIFKIIGLGCGYFYILQFLMSKFQIL